MAAVSGSTTAGHSSSAQASTAARRASLGTNVSAGSSGSPVVGHRRPPRESQDSMARRSKVWPVDGMVTGSRMSSRLTGQKKSAGAFAARAVSSTSKVGSWGSRSRRAGSGDHAGSAEGIGGYRGESGGVTGAIIVPEETRHVVAFFSGDGRPEAARARTRARQRRAGRATFAVTRTARGRTRRTRQAGSRARLWRRGATVEGPMPSAVTDDARG